MDINTLRSMKDRIAGSRDFHPLVGLVFGSGLSYIQELLEVKDSLEYSAIEGHPLCTNPSHRGRYLFATYKGVDVLVMDGRLHYYEGYDSATCVVPIRLLGLMGCKDIVLTNAVGGIRFKAGTPVLIKDQIATFVPSPLRGANIEALGTRFPDMSDVYDNRKIAAIQKKAEGRGFEIPSGTFMQFPGPQFETKAEVQMAKILGADLVGMSTGIEAIAARHMGLSTVGLSLVTNAACGIEEGALSDDDVVRASRESKGRVLMAMEAILDTLVEEEDAR